MRRITILLTFCCAVAAVRVEGTDVPYGTDALPQLVTDATLIFEASGSGNRRNLSRGTLVDVRVGKVIHGEVKAARVRVFGPEPLGGVPAKFADTLVFVFGPLTSDQKTEWGLPMADTIYQLVGGRFGVVPQTTARRNALDRYMSAGDRTVEGGVTWAESYLTSKDEFLQRSAIVELERQAPDNTAVDLLGRAARSGDVILENRTRAVDALGSAGTARAFSLLKTIAETRNVREVVRIASVEAISRLPEGRALIAQWASGSDTLLASTAARLTRD